MHHLNTFCTAAMIGLACTTGCVESYVTPNRGADMSALGVDPSQADAHTPAAIRREFDKQPLARFPASLAVVRIESPGYVTPTAEGWGRGRFSVVVTRDVESSDAFDKLRGLPQLRGIAPLNRILLPDQLPSDEPLREAAAKMQCDLLLVYTIDTQVQNQDAAIPLTALTLGLAPDQKLHVVSTVSAALMDTRSGYIYAVSEATDRSDDLTLAIFTEVDLDRMRRQTETKAFTELVDKFASQWTDVVTNFAPRPPATAPGTPPPASGISPRQPLGPGESRQ